MGDFMNLLLAYQNYHGIRAINKLSAARCKWFAFGPAGATATHHLLLH